MGGLADWYAVVALFRRPLGLPIPHTAIIPRNHHAHRRYAGRVIETISWPPSRSRRGCATSISRPSWPTGCRDRERAAALAGFVLRLLPQALGAIDQSGLKGFLGKRIMTELERVELAPLAAGC